MKAKKILLAIVLLAMLQACATNESLFYWGEYEQLIYDMYLKPGNATPEVQIEKLTADIQKAQSKGLGVAPGVYAHLGYMYAIQGSVADSEAAFAEEMALFPESRTLINAMLNRARKANKPKGMM